MKRPTEDQLRRFRSSVRRIMGEWHVPGMGVAVVAGGKTVLAEGLGLADTAPEVPATAETIFAVGSITKSFTATALGILVDEKKLSWDTPVRKYMSDFRLRDPLASEHATARDLLCHRTGLPRHDNSWYGRELERKALFKRLRRLAPSKDFRSCWQYQNMMFMVAGLLVEELSGLSWEQFVRERVFQPLGMDGASFYTDQEAMQNRAARPYRLKGRRCCRAPLDSHSIIGPAGAIVASAADMAKWIAFNLQIGKAGAKQIVSPATLKQIHTPQIAVDEPAPWPEMPCGTYALGWQVQSYRGHLTLWHGGLVNGYQAYIGLFPQQRAGAVALSNLTGQPPAKLAVLRACDMLLGLRPLPWPKRVRKQMQTDAKARAAQKRKAARDRKQDRARPRALARYVGEYSNPGYGVMKIVRAGRRLQAVWAGMAHAVRRDHGDVFEMDRPLWASKDLLTFHADKKGQITKITSQFEASVPPIVFRRRKT